MIIIYWYKVSLFSCEGSNNNGNLSVQENINNMVIFLKGGLLKVLYQYLKRVIQKWLLIKYAETLTSTIF